MIFKLLKLNKQSTTFCLVGVISTKIHHFAVKMGKSKPTRDAILCISFSKSSGLLPHLSKTSSNHSLPHWLNHYSHCFNALNDFYSIAFFITAFNADKVNEFNIVAGDELSDVNVGVKHECLTEQSVLIAEMSDVTLVELIQLVFVRGAFALLL